MPSQAGGGQVLRWHVPPATSRLQPVERLSTTKRLDLVIALPLRNREELTNLLLRIYNPSSPDYRRYLTPKDFIERFGPTEQDYQAVIAFATANGLTVTGRHPNRTLVDVNGSVADIERTFRLVMRSYQHPTEARKFFAPDTDPSPSAPVPILSINGLDDFVIPRPMNLNTNFLGGELEGVPYATGSGPRGAFLGKDFRAAYAPGVTLDGTGESVGLFQLDGYHPSDIIAYKNLAGLPDVPITNVLVGTFNGNPGFNNIEVALDIEMAISMAPGLSRVIVYEGNNPNDVLNRMATDNLARQLSCSWGFGAQVDPARQQIFQQFAAQGQSFFQASGDLGAWVGPIFPPSDDPFVTVVGGTSLTVSTPGGSWLSETTWPESGGGISTSYPIPVWQHAVSMTANQGSTTMRNIPDVAGLSDSVIWVVVNNGEHGVVGGTSAAAPLWAGFAALANQQAAATGKPAIGFINPAVYAIGQGPGYTNAFHDITTGNNTNAGSSNKFFAVPGFDLCTGWGTPNGSNLINALLAPAHALQITPPIRVTFAGPAGGPFVPPTHSLSLTNEGTVSLNWGLSNAAPWFNASPANGTLTSAGPTATVTLTLTSAASNLSIGSYPATIWFTNLNDGFVQSRQVNLEVGVQPLITSQPTNLHVLEGTTAEFAVGTASNAALFHQWRRDNGTGVTNLADGAKVSGSSTSTLTVSNASSADVGTYSVVVSNVLGTAASSNASLTIIPWKPVITLQPVGRTALPGETVLLTVGVVGSQPFTFQWRKGGINLSNTNGIHGATTSTLTISNISQFDAGTYSVVISHALGSETSSGAVVNVVSTSAPEVTLTRVYSFTGGNDGGNPNGLTLGTNDIFYGTTQYGGVNAAGTFFQMMPGGQPVNLHSFDGDSNGANPRAPLAQGPDGHFYGTTFQGGGFDNGTIFRITTAGLLTTLFSLDIPNGDLPYGGLTFGGGNFYGAGYQGGANGRGTLFRISTNGALTVLRSFSNGGDGGHPAATLLSGGDGNFYGATYKGGASGRGTIYKISTNGLFTTLASFNNTNGSFPFAGLASGDDGSFYGVTTQGGLSNRGAVFRITPSGQLTNLHSFTGGSDGGRPLGGLLLASDGNFYGTTYDGGAYGVGTVFRFLPATGIITLAQFTGYNGANPQSVMTQGPDGFLYGTTQNGGVNNQGAIFQLGVTAAPVITSQPSNQAVYAGATVKFNVSAYGSPQLFYQWRKSGVNMTDGGNVSGAATRTLTFADVTTAGAGIYSVIVSNALGTVTSADASLSVTVSPPLITAQPANLTLSPGETALFSVAANGSQPLSYQWQKNGTNLPDSGTISGTATSTLQINTVTESNNGTYAVIVSNLLGAVSSSNASLTVIPVSAAGTRVTTLHWFSGGDGRVPNGLMQATNGFLYGTTQFGGMSLGGTAFNMTTNGALTTLLSFVGTNGSQPRAALAQGVDGDLYGTTESGGEAGVGTVFRMTTNGAVTILHSFDGIEDSINPYTSITQGTDGNFFGAAVSLYTLDGNLFKISTNGTVTNFHAFTGGLDGSTPTGALLRGSDGNFFGMTTAGGAHGYGNIFRISPDGVLANLRSFANGQDGSAPVGALVEGTDGNFYGATKRNTIAGFQFYGTIFRISPGGQLTTLYALNFTDGTYPDAGLVEGADGNFYGTTEFGGPTGNGTLFRIAPNGTFETVFSFDGFNVGARPRAALVQATDGNIYGTASTGGPGGRGTIFRIAATAAPQITTQPANQTVIAGATARVAVAVFGAHSLFYQWRRNGTNLTDSGNISGSGARVLTLANVSTTNAGTYSVVVSNSLGSVTSAGALLTVLVPPAFQTVGLTNGSLGLSWSTTVGQRYQLQYKTNLNAVTWINLGGIITAAGGTLNASDAIGTNSQRFYRVILVP